MNETVGSKRHVTDVDSVRRALVSNGWRRTAFATEADFYYRTSDGSLGRMRSCGAFVEISVLNGDQRVLNASSQANDIRHLTVGWSAKPFARVEKTRTSYLSDNHPGVRVDIDCIPGTGIFLKTRSAFDINEVGLIETKLGFDRLEPTDAPYSELVSA